MSSTLHRSMSTPKHCQHHLASASCAQQPPGQPIVHSGEEAESEDEALSKTSSVSDRPTCIVQVSYGRPASFPVALVSTEADKPHPQIQQPQRSCTAVICATTSTANTVVFNAITLAFIRTPINFTTAVPVSTTFSTMAFTSYSGTKCVAFSVNRLGGKTVPGWRRCNIYHIASSNTVSSHHFYRCFSSAVHHQHIAE